MTMLLLPEHVTEDGSSPYPLPHEQIPHFPAPQLPQPSTPRNKILDGLKPRGQTWSEVVVSFIQRPIPDNEQMPDVRLTSIL